MAKEIRKTYSITIKYSRDDGADLSPTDLEFTELRKKILERIAKIVPISQGILSAHIVGEISESE